MNANSKILDKSIIKKPSLIPEQKNAWILIFCLVFFVTVCIVFKISSILQILFPLSTFLVGIFLYQKHNTLYLGFTWWIWFLSPFIARIVEYQNGWANPSMRLIILSPYLVTGITGISFFRHIPKTYRKDGLPFILAFIGVIYAFFIGLIQKSSSLVVIEGFLSWMPAIFFGFHIIVNWRDYPEYKQMIQCTFCWGIFLMGIYGLIQYFNLPPWDKFWLDNAQEVRGSIGWNEIRIWSTLNLPIAFTNAIVAGLLLLISNDKNKFSIPVSAIGFLCLLLARVRSSWMGFVVGLLTTVSFLKYRVQIKLLTTILILSLCIPPLVLIEPFYERIVPRLQTITNLQEDSSVNERLRRYSENGDSVLTNFLGSGLGTKQVDTGVLAVIDTLGWLGTIPYMGGLLILLLNSFRFVEATFDPFISASRAISLSVLTMTLGNNMMIRFYGVILWGFLAITFASHKYYQHQKYKIAELSS
ncbi:MAG: hypothetical protein Tsb0014_00260 [Pleurocapsa sp.]